ncbi:MAG: cytochrome c oxidase subunit 3 [Nitrococcus sp.]|nr:cytochrome c oxidase subunit 3 [Nitrococcus sp.]
MPPSDEAIAAHVPESRTLPGDIAIWLFILTELIVFGVLFVSLEAARLDAPRAFANGVRTLHVEAGLANTLVLITGSFFVALAVAAIRHGRARACTLLLLAGAMTGGLFTLIKVTEYQALIDAGYRLGSGIFYSFYFLATAFHLLHVLIAMLVVIIVAARCRFAAYDRANHTGVETAASFWHMVDLVWIVLFPLLYILP